MAFQYIQESDLDTVWQDSQKHMKPLFEPLDEFERIARNRPHPGIAKELPKVTDGTLAAIIQETPKRIIQQIPTGKVETEAEWLGLIAGYILEHEILPNANQVAALIQKCWALVSKSLTYGSQPAFVQFVNRGEYFGTDFTLPYIKDVFLEPGKLSDQDSCVMALRSWWTPSQIDGIVAKEQLLTKRAKDRGEKYESTWDLNQLIALKDEKGEKSADAQTPNERNKAQTSGVIEIVHFMQEGVGAKFYSWSPKTKEIVRRKTNKDPRGVIPIHYMYANVDLSNPLGRGVVEMSGGMQNLLDSEVQSYQYMRSLLMNPPIEKRGTFSKSQLKYAPGAIWDLGANENNSATPVKLETPSLQQFPDNYGLIKSQILNLNSGGTDNAIASSAGDPQSSKTPAGVKSQAARLSVSDNYIRKQFEDVFQDICETKVNLYFGERSGVQELKLDKETAMKIERMQPNSTRDGVIRIDYEAETPKLKFKVDASTSSLQDNETQLTALDSILQRYEKAPILQQIVPQDSIKEVWNSIIAASGVENPEKLQIKEEVDEQGNPAGKKNDQMTPEMIQQMVMETVKQAMDEQKKAPKPLSESLQIKFTDLPDDAKRQVLINELGIESNEPLPSETDNMMKMHDASLKEDAQVHQQNIQTTEAALKVAQAHHTHDSGVTDQALKIAQAEHSMGHTDRTQEFTEKQAQAQPKQPAGATK